MLCIKKIARLEGRKEGRKEERRFSAHKFRERYVSKIVKRTLNSST